MALRRKKSTVRDQVVSKIAEGADELKTRLPELQAALVDKLPDDVSDKLPETGKKKKKKKSKLKKLAFVGILAGVGGFIYSKLKSPAATPPAPEPTPTPTPARPTAVPDEPAATTEAPAEAEEPATEGDETSGDDAKK